MDQKEIGNRIHAMQRACWIDGKDCPYGSPEGQFLLRPLQFCLLKDYYRSEGCQRLHEHKEEFIGIFSQGELRKALLELVEIGISTRSLSDLISKASLEESFSKEERVLLELAAEIVLKSDCNGEKWVNLHILSGSTSDLLEILK